MNLETISQAITHLRQGGILAYPTDTLWGFGVDATNASAIANLNELKERPVNTPMSILVNDIAMADEYVHLTATDKSLLEILWPGPITFIFNSRQKLPVVLEGQTQGLGVRCIVNDVTNEFMWQFDGPITTTSANRGGMDPLNNSAEIRLNFPNDVLLLNDIARTGRLTDIDARHALEPRGPQGSCIVKINNDKYQILRQGQFHNNHLVVVLKSLGYSLLE